MSSANPSGKNSDALSHWLGTLNLQRMVSLIGISMKPFPNRTFTDEGLFTWRTIGKSAITPSSKALYSISSKLCEHSTDVKLR